MAVRKTKSRAELEAENRLLRSHQYADNISKVFQALIKYGAYVLIAYFAIAKPIESLSGKSTFADIKMDTKADVMLQSADKSPPSAHGVSQTDYCLLVSISALVFGFAGVRYGRKQAKLRKDVVERIQLRNQNLEKAIDPNRSTSALTPRGDTRPEDQ